MAERSTGEYKAAHRRRWWPAGWLWLWLWLLAVGPALGQAAREVPPRATLLPPAAIVPLVGPLQLGFEVAGPSPAKHSDFPEIEGFRKEKVVSTTTTRLLPDGKRQVQLAVVQRYFPYAEGDYVVPAFDLTVNGQLLHSPAAQVHVGIDQTGQDGAARHIGIELGADGRPPAAVGSLDQLLGKPKPKNFYEPPDHAFLALEADQSAVYVGQGVRVRLSLYLPPADQAVLNFTDFTNQLAALRQQLRQPTTWQTTPPAPPTLPDTVRRPGQPLLLRFGLVDYTYYPLTPQPLSFPALSLTLTKAKLLKNPQPGEDERLTFYKTYQAQPVRVAVRSLPGGSGTTAVGELVLRENLSLLHPRTNEAFTYLFAIEGTGNPEAVAPRATVPPPGLDVYGPEVRQETLGPDQWRKSFRYRLVARQPGTLALRGLVQLPFFNPVTARYDTLRPSVRVTVSGAAATPDASPVDDAFYGPALARADAELQPIGVYQQVRRYAGWVLAGLLTVAAVGAWRAGRSG